MFELIICSLVTILPDYLFRRYGQGKRIGREITLYSVWYELRYGIVTCLMLTVSLITLIFYFHPTASATALFRTVPILPETSGRVEELFVSRELETPVKAGDPIFRLDSRSQEAAVETAARQVKELEATLRVAEGDLAVASAQVDQARASLKQAVDEFETKSELQQRNASTVTEREVERLQTAVDARQAGVAAAEANRDLVQIRIDEAIPAQLESARGRLAEAEVALAKTTVYAGVDGTVNQFSLRVGDVVNPLMRPAGALVPADAAHQHLIAGFGQIEAQVLRVGMVAEAACGSVPFTIIPLVVTEVQTQIASGQILSGGQLIDAARPTTPGTITTLLEPLYPGGLDRVPPGSQCIVNAYTSNHDRLENDPDLGTGEAVFLHAVDTVGLVHAMILRLQAILFPVQTLVLTGH
ncbi:HlyD family secretion protein [Amorphus coralli]|uniref:HlyD family secretion protein n=1 Tax=Amorphus coralli TaxID=340680 RepID=UPI00036F655F|nr:HlyD family secretion protein [Amorphus coralli]